MTQVERFRLMGVAGALLLVLLLHAGCTPLAPGQQPRREVVTIFAAASLKDAFEALEVQFEAERPGVDLVLNLAGSQQLALQLANGAPADLLASANQRQLQVAIDAGRIATDTVQLFAGNRLVIVTPADNPGEVESLSDLATPGLKLVLAAESVPVGEYSREVLLLASETSDFGEGFADAVMANVVSYEENVRSVLNKVLLGEADAGIVYLSDAAPRLAADIRTVPIADEFNVPASYPVAVVADAPWPELAQEFLSLLLSPEGQSLLGDYGFVPVAEVIP